MSRTEQVLSVERPKPGVEILTVAVTNTPCWLNRLLGSKPVTREFQYVRDNLIGTLGWHHFPSMQVCSCTCDLWLGELYDAYRMLQRMSETTDD